MKLELRNGDIPKICVVPKLATGSTQPGVGVTFHCDTYPTQVVKHPVHNKSKSITLFKIGQFEDASGAGVDCRSGFEGEFNCSPSLTSDPGGKG